MTVYAIGNLTAICALWCLATPDDVGRAAMFESTKAETDIDLSGQVSTDLSTDPGGTFWRLTSAVYAEQGSYGEAMPQFRTEIRSRWTKQNLYFLFACPYEQLNLNPSPNTSSETFRLWDRDVAEVFIGSDFQNIQRYKEFEISPQGEWVDLDVDLTKANHEDGWVWKSGVRVAARVDPASKVWYGAMRIPFEDLASRAPASGETFRINMFWSQQQGAKVAWQPTMSHTFHVPERFGLLRLVEEV
jgi:hypothetical protein